MTRSRLGNELLAGLTLTEVPGGSLPGPISDDDHGTVFGGQMLGQAIVTVAREIRRSG